MKNDPEIVKVSLKDPLEFHELGFVPAVVQDWITGTVLMLGFMNQEALDHTQKTGLVHFWSRRRQRLWKKGEVSGNYLHVKQLFLDCDGDTILIKVQPSGPTCHTGSKSCFFSGIVDSEITVEPETEKAQVAWGTRSVDQYRPKTPYFPGRSPHGM